MLEGFWYVAGNHSNFISGNPMATITCKCSAVRITFPVSTELFRHECCCHDCISALWYSTQRGGPEYPRDHCADCCWLPNDFCIEQGAEKLGALLNFAAADTTRFYCTSCWTLLFGDHPLYESRILVSLIASYKEFEGLTDIVRLAPQARHFLKDLNDDQIAALPQWSGDPVRVYPGAAAVLLENFPAMKAAGGKGRDMNAQKLLDRIGGPLVPSDATRLRSGPPSLMQQAATSAESGDEIT